MNQQSQAMISSQGSVTAYSPHKKTVISPGSKNSLNLQFTNKNVSADLAHLSEPESPSPKKQIGNNQTFRLDHAKDSSKVLLEEHDMSGNTLKVYDMDLVQLKQMPQPIVNAGQIQVMKLGSLEVLHHHNRNQLQPSRNSSQRKELPTAHVKVQIQAFDINNVPTSQMRNFNRFRSEVTSANKTTASQFKVSSVSTQIQPSAKYDGKTITQTISQQKNDSSEGGIHMNQTKTGTFPLIPRASNYTITGGDEMENFLNRSSIGFQGPIDANQPVSFGQTMQGHYNKNGKKGSISPSLGRHQQIIQQGYLPAKVDIGIRGVMPFDAQLLKKMNKRDASPLSTMMSKMSIFESNRRGRSELGFYKTNFQTTSQIMGGIQSNSVSNDYQLSAVGVNHPGTLLKNVNPKIAPKNQESEFARKKVQNLLKKSSVQVTQILCQESCISMNKKHVVTAPKKVAIIDTEDSISIKPITPKVSVIQADSTYEKSSVAHGGLDTNQSIEAVSMAGARDSIKTKYRNKTRQQLQFSKHSIAMITKPSDEPPPSPNQTQKVTRKISKDKKTTIATSTEPAAAEQLQVKRMSIKNSLKPLASTGSLDEEVDVALDAEIIHTTLLQKEHSQPVVENIGTLFLENLNTNTHRLLLTNESVDGKEFGTRGLQTKSPSVIEVTETKGDALKAVQKSLNVSSQNNEQHHPLICLINKIEQDSETMYEESAVLATIQPVDNAEENSYNAQMLGLLMNKNQSPKRPVNKQVGPAKKEECLCGNDLIHNQNIVNSNYQEVEQRGPDAQLSAWEGSRYPRFHNMESPFNRIQAPTPHTVTAHTPLLADDVEQEEKIKQIVKEVIQSQNKQIMQSNGTERGVLMPVARHGGAQNKHKMQLTNLIVPQARTGTFTQFNSIQASQNSRDMQKKGFKDPLLNMITSIYSVNDSVNAKKTMYGFQSAKNSCLPHPASKIVDKMEESDYLGTGPMGSSTYKTSRAPLMLIEQLVERQRHQEEEKTIKNVTNLRKNQKNRMKDLKMKARRHSQIEFRTDNNHSIALNQTSSVMIGDQNCLQESSHITQSKLGGLRSKEREFHSLSSERYSPSNLINNYETEQMHQTAQNANIIISDQNGNAAAHQNLQKWINQDIEVIHNRMLDSETGNRDFVKNRPDEGIQNRSRLIKTGMGSKSPAAGGQFGEIINSGASIVMSKVHKVPSPPPVDLNSDGQEQHIRDSMVLVQEKILQSHQAQCSLAENQSHKTSNVDKQSLVQMIELELPNVIVGEDKVSPQRIKVLSREYSPDPNKESTRTPPIILTKDQQKLSNHHKTHDIKGFKKQQNDRGQINEQSFENLNEAQILNEMEATIDSQVSQSESTAGQQNDDAEQPSKFTSLKDNNHTRTSKEMRKSMMKQNSSKVRYSQQKSNARSYETSNEHHDYTQGAQNRGRSTLPVITTMENDYRGEGTPYRLQQRFRSSQQTNNESQLPIQITTKGKTHLQYVQQIRALAEQMGKTQPLVDLEEQQFTLVSNGVAIHGDTNIKQSKSKYYNHLKEQQIAMKQMYNDVKDCRQKDRQKEIKNQLKLKKQSKLREKAQTQLMKEHKLLIQKLDRPGQTIQVAVKQSDLEIRQEMMETSMTKLAQMNVDGDINEIILVSNLGSKQQKIDASVSLPDTTEMIATGENVRNSNNNDLSSPKVNEESPTSKKTISVFKTTIETKKNKLYDGSYEKQILPITKTLNKLKNGTNEQRNQNNSNLTLNTIALPEKQYQTEMEQEGGLGEQKSQPKLLQFLPSPPIGAALEQIQVERQQRNNNLSQVQTQTNLFGGLISNRQSELSFMQLKQQELENPDLAELGKNYHNRESVHYAKGFKSGVKKLANKEKIKERRNQVRLHSLIRTGVGPSPKHHNKVKNINESEAKLDLQGNQLCIDSRSPVNGNFGHGTTSQQLFAHLLRENSQDDRLNMENDENDYQQQVLGSNGNTKNKTKTKKKTGKQQHREIVIHGITNLVGDPDATLDSFQPWSKGGRNVNDLAEASDIIQQQLYSSEEEEEDEEDEEDKIVTKQKKTYGNQEGAVLRTNIPLVSIEAGPPANRDAAMGTDEIQSLKSLRESQLLALSIEEEHQLSLSQFDNGNISTKRKKESGSKLYLHDSSSAKLVAGKRPSDVVLQKQTLPTIVINLYEQRE